MLGTIPDHIREHLEILFVGFNPSLLSGTTGHHYANPSNRFWKILFEAGLTERLLKPAEDAALLEAGYGLTNIVSRPTRAAEEITSSEYAAGREILRDKIMQFRPKIVCFVGKGVYREFSGKRQIVWGRQPDSVVPGVDDFVAPSSSGLVRMKMEEVVEIYRELRNTPSPGKDMPYRGA